MNQCELGSDGKMWLRTCLKCNKIWGNSTNWGESINTDTSNTILFQYSQIAFFALIESILSKQNPEGPLQTGLFFTRPMFYLIHLLCLRNLFRKSILTWHRPFVNSLVVWISTWVIWGTHIPWINPRHKENKGIFDLYNASIGLYCSIIVFIILLSFQM